MPDLGINAIYKAARAITKIENFKFFAQKDELHGFPTINVGLINGGKNLNSVPDHVEFTIDIRSTGKLSHSEILERLSAELGEEVNIQTLVDLPAVSSDENSSFVKVVYEVCGVNPELKTSENHCPT